MIHDKFMDHFFIAHFFCKGQNSIVHFKTLAFIKLVFLGLRIT